MQQFESVGKVSKEIHGTMAKIMATPVATVIMGGRNSVAYPYAAVETETVQNAEKVSGERLIADQECDKPRKRQCTVVFS